MNSMGRVNRLNDIEKLRGAYQPGTRIRFCEMGYPDPQPLNPGQLGTVDFVDDAGQIHMKWDNGRTLAIIPGLDKFEIIAQKKEEQ